MARILTISSQVVYGPVGNTAAAPVMQALGHEVMQVPTILLSNHPGLGKPEARATESEFFEALLKRCESQPPPAGILTGYFAHPDQATAAARSIRILRKLNPDAIVVVDPVIGDDGKLYVGAAVAEAIRDELLPMAQAATPNYFELGWLSGQAPDDLVQAAAKLGCDEVIVTSVPIDDKRIGNALVLNNVSYLKPMRKRPRVANGTGDVLAGAYLGCRLLMPANSAFIKAIRLLQNVIRKSDGEDALRVAAPLER